MTKKEKFVLMVEEMVDYAVNTREMELDSDALAYFDALKQVKEKEKPAFTDNGKQIMTFMQSSWEQYNNLMKAKDIADGTFLSSRSVSGSIRKLVTDGYVEKIGQDPINYALTDLGKEVVIGE